MIKPRPELAALDGPADEMVAAALAYHGPGREAAVEAIACALAYDPDEARAEAATEAHQDAAAEWAAGYDPWGEGVTR